MTHHARVTTTPEIDDLLARNAVAAVGVSGGKDSQACALAVEEHLNAIGHTGPRVLIHSDLGRVEWKQSLAKCEELAAALGWELIVVRRNAGDMMDRWLVRWDNNVTRYANLEAVKVILPWSTPTWRFCTSELKSAIINSALKKRFPGQDVINVTGIRRQESSSRAKMPVAKLNPACANKGGAGWTWNPIIEWDVQEVYDIIERRGLELHEAYTQYGMTRVSCAFCIMSSASDMLASSKCEDNHAIYREMVELEARSTFAFQSNKWLGDTNPAIIGPELQTLVAQAKINAAMRERAEARIPEHLMFEKGTGFPVAIPSREDAELLAGIRREVAGLLGIQIGYTDADAIIERYTQLMTEKENKQASSNIIPSVQVIPTMNVQLGLF